MVKLRSTFVWFVAVLLSSIVLCAGAQQKPAAATPATAPPAVASDGPPVVPHPHKIFVDAQANKLFWPMDMPFWVRLAASPDANAPSYLLQRVAPDSDITTEKYNKEGIELEIRGKQFIRWFNYVTKQTVMLQFFTDGDPPTTKATCTGAPASVFSQKQFYGKGLHCALTAEDELSGVESTFVSVNNEPWKPYTKDLVLDTEGDVTLRYYSVDHTGWDEKPSVLHFIVDLTPPATTSAIAGNALGDVLSTQAKFRIASASALSGVATLQARFDQQEFKPVIDGEVSVENLPDGPHTLSYYAVDHVANREPDHVVPFYLDRIPPVSSAKVVGDLFVSPNGTRFVSGRSHVQLDAQDNKSGVARIDYSFEGDQFQLYGQPFLLPARGGSAKLSFRATDKLGNTSEVSTLPYTMDLIPPQSTYHITGPSYQVRSDIYITRDTRIELSSVDDGAGVQHIQFQEEGTPSPTIYTAPLAFPDEARRLVRYWSTDLVNNRELDRALVLITDNEAPQIFANFSIAPIVASNSQGLPVYRHNTSLFLGATDNASGVHRIYYSFDGSKEMEYSTPLLLDHPGTFDLLIRVDDNLGNESSKHIHFVIQG